MNFHEERFPAQLSLGSSGGPERRTEIVTLVNGHEERNTAWAHSRRKYDAGIAMKSLDDLSVVIAFFEARMARLFGFRWKDWADYKSCNPSRAIGALDQELGLGDGAQTAFQLIKTYSSGAQKYVRQISKPVAGSVKIALDDTALESGQDFGVDANSGLVTLFSPPASGAVVTAGFEFDVPVRFDTDFLDVTIASFQAGEIPNVPIIEVRV